MSSKLQELLKILIQNLFQLEYIADKGNVIFPSNDYRASWRLYHFFRPVAAGELLALRSQKTM